MSTLRWYTKRQSVPHQGDSGLNKLVRSICHVNANIRLAIDDVLAALTSQSRAHCVPFFDFGSKSKSIYDLITAEILTFAWKTEQYSYTERLPNPLRLRNILGS